MIAYTHMQYLASFVLALCYRVLAFQAVLDLLSGEKNARIKSIKDAIEQESKVEGQLSVRHDVFDILKVSSYIYATAGINARGTHTHPQPPEKISPNAKIRLNCQWFIIIFMILSLHVVIIIKLMFKVNA